MGSSKVRNQRSDRHFQPSLQPVSFAAGVWLAFAAPIWIYGVLGLCFRNLARWIWLEAAGDREAVNQHCASCNLPLNFLAIFSSIALVLWWISSPRPLTKDFEQAETLIFFAIQNLLVASAGYWAAIRKHTGTARIHPIIKAVFLYFAIVSSIVLMIAAILIDG